MRRPDDQARAAAALVAVSLSLMACGSDGNLAGETARSSTRSTSASDERTITAAQARKLWRSDDPGRPEGSAGRRTVANAIVAGRLLPAATEREIRAVLGRPVNRTRKREKIVLGYQVGVFQRRPDLACSRVLEFVGRDARYRATLTDFCAPGDALPSPRDKP